MTGRRQPWKINKKARGRARGRMVVLVQKEPSMPEV
jgi:hypothetical protein